jgi:hypothetical protein
MALLQDQRVVEAVFLFVGEAVVVLEVEATRYRVHPQERMLLRCPHLPLRPRRLM